MPAAASIPPSLTNVPFNFGAQSSGNVAFDNQYFYVKYHGWRRFPLVRTENLPFRFPNPSNNGNIYTDNQYFYLVVNHQWRKLPIFIIKPLRPIYGEVPMVNIQETKLTTFPRGTDNYGRWGMIAFNAEYISASFALEASAAISAAFANDASHSISASHADYADYAGSSSYTFSASYAESASYGTNFYAPRVTASYVSASGAIYTNQLTASNILVRGEMLGTASYADAAANANFANQANTALYATLAENALTASVATSSISASHALVSDTTIGTVANAASASYAFSASYAESASYEIIYETSSSYADFAKSSSLVGNNQSYIVANDDSLPVVAGNSTVFTFGKDGGSYNESNLSLKGNLIGTASWATTASYANFALLASSSLGTRGLNVNNIPPMPNADIQFAVADGHPAALVGTASVPDAHTHATIKVGNKLYGGGWDGFIFVMSDPDGNLSDITSSWCIAGGGISQVAYSAGTGYLYFINGATPTGSIVKVDPNDVANQTILVNGLAGYPSLPGLAADNDYLYTILGTTIVKYDINTGAVVGTAASYGSSHGGGEFAPGTPYVFFCGGSRVTRINTSSLANDGVALHYGFSSAALVDDMAYLNGKVYVQHDASIGGFAGAIWDIDVNTLATGSWNYNGGYPMDYGGWGVWTDNQHIYTLQPSVNELWMYLNGNLDEGPVRFTINDSPNELWITDAGRFCVHDFNAGKVYAWYLPYTQVGINKQPSNTLDIAGSINAITAISTSYVSASTSVSTQTLSTVNETLYGTLTVDGTGIIRSSTSNALRITSGSVRAATLSSSAALLGRALNIRFSQSFMAGDVMAYTRSLGTVAQDGMYRLTVAGTIGFYSGSTLQNQPKWQFLHTDRMGAYTLPQTPLTPVTLTAPPNYEYAFSFGSDYIFQAVAGTTVEYYYATNGGQVSSTDCSASFFTTTTLAQILSGSVTGSV